jgi:hypothetical protein
MAEHCQLDQCMTLVNLSYNQACEVLSGLQRLSGATIGNSEACLLARQACKNLATLQDQLRELCDYYIEI